MSFNAAFRLTEKNLGDEAGTQEDLEAELESDDEYNARRKKGKRKVIEVESDDDVPLQPFTGPSQPPPPAPAAPDNGATKRTLKEMSSEEPAGKVDKKARHDQAATSRGKATPMIDTFPPQPTGRDDNLETLQPSHEQQPSIRHSPEANTMSRESSSAIQPQTRFEKEAFPPLADAWRIARDTMQAADEKITKNARPGYLKYLVFGRLIRIYGRYWTEEDQAKLVRVWSGSVLERALEQRGSIHTHMVTVWRISMRIFRQDPLTLFTLGGDDLDMDTRGGEMIKIGGRSYKSPLWTPSFCKNLAMIMTHPLWDGKENWAFMLFALKWAVICRSGDLRPLKHMDVDMLEAAGCHIPPSPTELPASERLKNHRQIMWDQGRWPTPESNLLVTIADKTQPRNHGSPSDLYSVTTRDLTKIIESLDAMSKRGVVVPCEAHFQAFWGSLEAQAWPGPSDIPSLYKRCWFEIERNRGRAQRKAAKKPGSSFVVQRRPIEKLHKRTAMKDSNRNDTEDHTDVDDGPDEDNDVEALESGGSNLESEMDTDGEN
ncbi:hypothetical protein NM208_g8821 [Fusarium decemcellulare]|uniref:Uncharacterized protein n=1 Tax=Fusarium decemcellulare TaxID=57161 RepID=A0ACC1S3U9_9HYPO|nr:hypothetical protein NM208_g8821 [Fusarium decemcellulare]